LGSGKEKRKQVRDGMGRERGDGRQEQSEGLGEGRREQSEGLVKADGSRVRDW